MSNQAAQSEPDPGHDPVPPLPASAALPATGAPPTARVVHAQRPAWPTVLGIIAIVLGGGGLLANAWGVVSSLVFRSFGEKWFASFPQAGITEMMDAMRPWQFRLVILSAVSAVISAMLLGAGIGLVKRRPWCVPVVRAWSGLRMVACCVQAVLTYFASKAQFAAMTQAGNNLPPGFGGAFGSVMGAIGGVFVVLWGCAFPIFMLLWFARPTIRVQVESWRPRGARA